MDPDVVVVSKTIPGEIPAADSSPLRQVCDGCRLLFAGPGASAATAATGAARDAAASG